MRTVGVEEELLLVDVQSPARSSPPRPEADAVEPGLEPRLDFARAVAQTVEPAEAAVTKFGTAFIRIAAALSDSPVGQLAYGSWTSGRGVRGPGGYYRLGIGAKLPPLRPRGSALPPRRVRVPVR